MRVNGRPERNITGQPLMGAKTQTDCFDYNITGNTAAMVEKVKDCLQNSHGVCPTIALLTIVATR